MVIEWFNTVRLPFLLYPSHPFWAQTVPFLLPFCLCQFNSVPCLYHSIPFWYNSIVPLTINPNTYSDLVAGDRSLRSGGLQHWADAVGKSSEGQHRHRRRDHLHQSQLPAASPHRRPGADHQDWKSGQAALWGDELTISETSSCLTLPFPGLGI